MSGLTQFFQKEFSSSLTIGEAPSYHQSLKDIPSREGTSRDDATASTVPVVWDWNEYQREKAATIKRFIRARFGEPALDEVHKINDKENQERTDVIQKQPPSAAVEVEAVSTSTTDYWETQPPEVHVQQAFESTSNNNNIPPFSELKQTIRSVSEIDLYAHTIHLQLCHLVKLVPLRETKRGELYPIYQDDGPLGVAYTHVIDFELRQHVTIMDTTSTDPQLRQCIQKLQNQKHRDAQNTIHVFLYNAFARQFQNVLDKMHKYTKDHVAAASKNDPKHDSWQVYVQLQNVPAQCVWQHTTTNTSKTGRNNQNHDKHDDDEWYPKTMFCLCIGDKSKLRPRSENHHLWFCNPDDNQDHTTNQNSEPKSSNSSTTTSLSVILVNNRQNTVHVEYNIQSHLTLGAYSTQIAPSSSSSSTTTMMSTLRQAYQEFRKQNKKQKDVHREHAPPADQQQQQEDEDDESPEIPMVKLRDLDQLLVEQKYNKIYINISCAVLSFTQPKLTSRGEWSMSANLIDESLSAGDDDDYGFTTNPSRSSSTTTTTVESVVINMFAVQREKLPQILYAGDVMELYNVQLGQWNGQVQMTGFKTGPSYVVHRCRRNNGGATTLVRNNILPNDSSDMEETLIYSANPNFRVTKRTKRRMRERWTWAQKRLLFHPTMKPSHRFTLSDLKFTGDLHVEQTYGEMNGDLTVMVTAIFLAPSNEGRRGISPIGYLRVWDGTGKPTPDPLPCDTIHAREATRNGDPPMEAVVKLAEIIYKIQKIRDNADLQPPKELSGRVANVAIWESPQWEFINHVVQVGSFIRLRNVRDDKMPDSEARGLHVSKNSSLTPLPALTYEVVHLLEEHNNRLLRQEPTNEASGVLPLNYHVGEASRGSMVCVVTNIQDAISGPLNVTFEVQIQVTKIIPSLLVLESRGLEQICPLNIVTNQRFFEFGLGVQDNFSNSMDVIVSEDLGFAVASASVGQTVFGMTAEAAIRDKNKALFNLQKLWNEKRSFKANIQAVAYNGQKYFLLKELSEL